MLLSTVMLLASVALVMTCCCKRAMISCCQEMPRARAVGELNAKEPAYERSMAYSKPSHSEYVKRLHQAEYPKAKVS